jgi:predicted Zn finger-like uncharacterized protein
MIVVCSGCSARFRVADEKVGARGAKVRCSRCQTVFLVRREPQPAPATVATPEMGLRPLGEPLPGPAHHPLSEPLPEPHPGAHHPLSEPPPDQRPDAHHPLSEPPPDQGYDAQDPFAGEADPFAGHGGADPFAGPADGRLGGLDPSDPFAPLMTEPRLPVSPPPRPPEWPRPDPRIGFDVDLEPPTAKVTVGASRASAEEQLADSFSEAALDPAQPAAPSAPPADDPFAAVAAPVPDDLARPVAGVDPFAALPADAHALSSGGISLEERSGPPPLRGRGLLDPLADPAPDTFGQGLSHAAAAEGMEDYAAPPAPEEPPPEPPAARGGVPLREDPFAAAAVDAAPVLQPPPPRPAPPGPAAQAELERAGVSRRGAAHLRAAAVNAVSLAALMLLTVALLVTWRGKVPLAEALRPSTVLRVLGHGTTEEGPFRLGQVSSGLYERAAGPPVLYVRGVVTALEAAPGVRVTVEVLRSGRPVARGQALAGEVPGPEAVFDPPGPDGRPALLHPVSRGDTLPFLAVIDTYPPDLFGASLRVTAEAASAP